MFGRLKNIFIPTAKNRFLPESLQNKPLFWYAVGLIALKIALISAFLFLPHTQLFSDIASNELLNLINQARQEKSLPVLTLNNQLNSAAQLKANDMVTNSYFDHTSPTASKINLTTSAGLSQTGSPNDQAETVKPATKILGAFVSNFEETTKSLYLYFTLFLLIALGVNIFVKIRIQRWPAIFATTALIGLSALLIFI